MDIVLQILILVTAIILHECAHGWMAYKLGDPTAKDAGRLTLNPIKHIDPVGSILLPGILFLLNMPLFGWAKPVPINFLRLKNPKRDMMLVGMAGPLTNIFIALIASQILKINLPAWGRDLGEMAILINVLLATFNMIPILPLDGSRLVAGLLPNSLMISYLRLEPYGIMIVMLLLALGSLNNIIIPIVYYVSQLLGVRA